MVMGEVVWVEVGRVGGGGGVVGGVFGRIGAVNIAYPLHNAC